MDLLYVVSQIRERDWHELSCVTDLDKYGFAATVWQSRSNGVSFIALADDGEPVAAFGSRRMFGSRQSLWFFATDRWDEVRLGVTKFAIKTLIPYLFSNGMTHGECLSLSAYPQIHKWLKLLGGKEGDELRDWGKNGENFKRFIWRK